MPLVTINLRTPRHDHLMRLDLDPGQPNEETVLNSLAAGLLYEADIAGLFLRALQEGDTVLDVGANIGVFSIMAAKLVGPSGRVVGFEPASENLERLAANLARNDLANVVVVEQPASDEIEDVVFHLNSDNQGGHALWPPGTSPPNTKSRAAPRSITVRSTTIDAEMTRLGLAPPRLIKIDVEGAEHQVLKGAANLLREFEIPYIVAELNEFGLQQMGSSQAALRDFMAELGYDTFLLYADDGLPRMVPRETRITSSIFLNLLFSTPADVAALWPVVTHDPFAILEAPRP